MQKPQASEPSGPDAFSVVGWGRAVFRSVERFLDDELDFSPERSVALVFFEPQCQVLRGQTVRQKEGPTRLFQGVGMVRQLSGETDGFGERIDNAPVLRRNFWSSFCTIRKYQNGKSHRPETRKWWIFPSATMGSIAYHSHCPKEHHIVFNEDMRDFFTFSLDTRKTRHYSWW